MSTHPLKTNQDLFTEAEVDFEKTFGQLFYLEMRAVPDYQNQVINSETGEVLSSLLLDETGRLLEDQLPEGVQAEVRSRPIEGTLAAYDLILESETLGMPIEITVPPSVNVKALTYNQVVKLKGCTARHWSRNSRQVYQGRVNITHTQGFKIRAEGIVEAPKLPPKPDVKAK